MLKIYKPQSYSYGFSDPVKLDNTVVLPGEEETEEANKPTEEELELERQKKAAEEEARILAEVERRVKTVLEGLREKTDAERREILGKASQESKKITDDAREKTAAVLEKANKECAILKEKAKAEGFKEGFDEGKRQSLEKCGKYIDASAQLLSDINSKKDSYFMDAEEDMREIMCEMLEKITGEELKVNPAVIENIIETAAKNFRNSDYIKVSLAQGEVSREIKTDAKLIKTIIPYIKDIEIEILPDAEDGTVILDNGEEILDASVPTQLEFLKEIMRNTRGEEEEQEKAGQDEKEQEE